MTKVGGSRSPRRTGRRGVERWIACLDDLWIVQHSSVGIFRRRATATIKLYSWIRNLYLLY